MEYTKKRVIRFVPSIHSLKERIIMSENDAVGEWPCFCGHIQQHLNLLLQSLKIALCRAQMWMILLNDRINDALETKRLVKRKFQNLANNQFIFRIGKYYTKIANILDVIESSRQRIYILYHCKSDLIKGIFAWLLVTFCFIWNWGQH